MGGLLRDDGSRFHMPRETARSQRFFLDALAGYSVTSTVMIADSIIASQSLLSYSGPGDPKNFACYKALRERFPLKQLPTDSVDPMTVHFNSFSKSTKIAISGNYCKIYSSIAPECVANVESANEYIRSLAWFSGQDYNRTPEGITSFVGNFNVIAQFIEKY